MKDKDNLKILDNNISEKIDNLRNEIDRYFKFIGKNTKEDLLQLNKEITIGSSKETIDNFRELIKERSEEGKIKNINNEKLSKKEQERLVLLITEINSSILDSQKQREFLKLTINNREYKEDFKFTKPLYSKDFLHKVKNPQNVRQQILGLGVGLLETGAAVGAFSYDIGKGIIKLPYDIYLMITGKGKYNGNIKI